MKIGISSWAYTWNIGVTGYEPPAAPFAWRELLAEAIRLKAEVLQIADNCPLERLEDIDALAAGARQAGIALETGTRGVRPEKLMPFVEISQRLGAGLVRTLLHDGADVPRMEEAYACLREVLPELAKQKVVLAIENHDLYAASSLRALVERINSPWVRVCLDPVNNFAQGESVQEVLRELGSLSACFHCKDFTIGRIRSGMGFSLVGCPVGQGMLHVERCLRELPMETKISCVVELWTPWRDTIEQTCKCEREWAEMSMKYLGSLQKGGSVYA